MSYIKVNEDMTFKSSIDKFLTDDLRKRTNRKMSFK